MKYLLFILFPFLIFAQTVTTKKFGDVRVREQLPVIESGYDFDDVMGTYAFDTTYIYAVTDSLAEDIATTDSINDVYIDSLVDYALISDLDSLATTSPFRDSIISVISDSMYLQEDLLEEDLRFPVSAVRLAGANTPTSTLYLGGEVLSFPTNVDATIYFEAQIPHFACDMRVDSIMFSDSVGVHIHCAYSANGTNPDSVRWVFTYTWANINDEFPTETTVNKTITVTDRVDSTHYLEGITYINSTNKRFSSMLLMSLTRDISEDNYAGSVYLLEVDIHYLKRDYYNDF